MTEEALKTFTFRVRGHGQDIPAVVVQAKDEKGAFREASRSCKSFTLPGWQLYCVETGSSQGAAVFHDTSTDEKLRA